MRPGCTKLTLARAFGTAGRGRDGPHGPPPAQIRTCGLRSIRPLAQVIASRSVTSAVPLATHVFPALRKGVWEVQKRHCPRAAAFPPFPPPQPLLVCSGTSTVLCSGPTAWVRSLSAYGHALPDTFGAGLLHRCGLLHGRYTQALPISVHSACVHGVSTPSEQNLALSTFFTNVSAIFRIGMRSRL
jgi:hypothetical protein